MQVFVSDIDGYVGAAVAAALRKAFPDAALAGSSTRNAPLPERVFSTGSPLAVEAAVASNVVILNLLSSLTEAAAVVESLRDVVATLAERAGDVPEPGAGKTVVAISSTLTWDRTTSMPQPWEEGG